MGALLETIRPLVEDVGLLIDAFGILIILAAVVEAAISFFQVEFGPKAHKHQGLSEAKHEFVHRLVFGLDFLIAGDVLKSAFTPTVDQLMLVGGIVIIRSVLSFSLMKELGQD